MAAPDTKASPANPSAIWGKGGTGHIANGAPFLAQVGAKSYRGPDFRILGGGELKILGLTDLV